MTTISPEARCWAVKELARRAGVTRDFFNSWTIEIRPDVTIVYVQPETGKQIRFRTLSSERCNGLAGPAFHTIHAGWMSPPEEPVKSAVPDLVVPFCEEVENGDRSLFWRANADRVECFVDLPASALFSLCRVEEEELQHRDIHSRFTAAMSVARRDAFLDRPIVDEWGLAFEQALEALLPGWRPTRYPLRVKISHDVDDIGGCAWVRQANLHADRKWLGRVAWTAMPFDLRHAIKLSIHKHSPIQGAAHVLRTMAPGQPSCLDLVQTVVSAPLKRGLDSAVYWMASRLGPFDSGYDPRDNKIRNAICRLRELGVENGVHPGYQTFRRPLELEAEVQTLRTVLGEQQLGGRQHYLRWCPETWMDWENCGLAYDNTVGYADHSGFRAGTCIPYRPWLLPLNREARLLEIPLIVMDTTLLEYMRLLPHETLDLVSQLIRKCRVVGGVFTFLCHNTTMRDVTFVQQYEQILDMVGSSERFDWKSQLSDDWLRFSDLGQHQVLASEAVA